MVIVFVHVVNVITCSKFKNATSTKTVRFLREMREWTMMLQCGIALSDGEHDGAHGAVASSATEEGFRQERRAADGGAHVDSLREVIGGTTKNSKAEKF